jgi:transposase
MRSSGFRLSRCCPAGRAIQGSDNRLFVNGCLWVLRSGAHWCNLPERYAIVRAHHQAATGKGASHQALGRSRGGLTSKTHMLADTLGRPLRVILTAGQTGDITTAPALLDGLRADAVLADKAYDSNALRAIIAVMGATAVILSNRTRKVDIPHDTAIYKHRNCIERCFNRFKHFRRFATRYDRRAIRFLGFVHLAAAIIWLR